MNLKINHAAAIVCIVFLHVLGFLWYGLLFREQWISLAGYDPNAPTSGDGEAGIWFTNFVACAAQVYFIAWLLAKLNVTSGARGAIIAFAATFCLYHLPLMSGNMFQGEPYGLAWIYGGFAFVGLAISGFILGAWTKRVS